MCGVPKILEHLLFSFTYVKPLWTVVYFVFDLFITFETLTTKLSLFSFPCCLVCVLKNVLIKATSQFIKIDPRGDQATTIPPSVLKVAGGPPESIGSSTLP